MTAAAAAATAARLPLAVAGGGATLGTDPAAAEAERHLARLAAAGSAAQTQAARQAVAEDLGSHFVSAGQQEEGALQGAPLLTAGGASCSSIAGQGGCVPSASRNWAGHSVSVHPAGDMQSYKHRPSGSPPDAAGHPTGASAAACTCRVAYKCRAGEAGFASVAAYCSFAVLPPACFACIMWTGVRLRCRKGNMQQAGSCPFPIPHRRCCCWWRRAPAGAAAHG